MRGWREGVDKETGHEIMKTPSAVTPCAFTPDSLIKGSRQDGGFGPEGGGADVISTVGCSESLFSLKISAQKGHDLL